MAKLVKVYSVSFMKHINAMQDTVWNEETDEYLDIGRETFLVKEDDLSKFKAYGNGYRSINYVGNMYIDEENKYKMELIEGYKGISNQEELEKILNKNAEVVTGYYKINEEGYGVPIKEVREKVYRDCPVYESETDAMENLEPHHGYGIAPDKRYLVPEVPTIKVRYHKELCPELIEMGVIDKGDFIDLRSAENVELKQGDFKLISLGISIQLPKGYHAEVVPRSSTYKNFGIIMSNSIGIIDESYCGDNDIWRFPAIAMRDTEIHVNDRICQFRIVKNRELNIEVVDRLENEDRGGIGSTGKN